MSIAVAIRTSTAVVFATDSKLTTSGLVGYNEDGSPNFLEQTYDTACKWAHDQSKTVMASIVGNPQIGLVSALDFILAADLKMPDGDVGRGVQVKHLISTISAMRAEHWQGLRVPEDQWPSTTLLLSAAFPKTTQPRTWQVAFEGPDVQTTEILKRPFLWMEGSSTDAMCLLYGCRPDVLEGLREALGVPGDRFYEATGRNKVILPIGKVNFDAMPTQDAVELAFFIASVQIQMDRFLPGTPKCGGCVDIVMLRTVPRPLVHVFPGMILHHPAGKVGIQR